MCPSMAHDHARSSLSLWWGGDAAAATSNHASSALPRRAAQKIHDIRLLRPSEGQRARIEGPDAVEPLERPGVIAQHHMTRVDEAGVVATDGQAEAGRWLQLLQALRWVDEEAVSVLPPDKVGFDCAQRV